MLESQESASQNKHLRSALVYFVVWVGVALLMVSEINDRWSPQKLLEMKDGDFYRIFLVSLSVVLLALSIKSFVSYFQSKK